MHEGTRRNLCRLMFLALGVLPTVCTMAWAGYRASPLYAAVERAHWEQRLVHLTGLQTRIGRVERLNDGGVLLSALEFVDPDDNQRVATIRQAEFVQRTEGILVLLSQPEVAQGKFLRIWDAWHQRILQGPTPESAVQITTGELTLDVGHHAQTFTRVRCTIEPHQTGIRTWIDFQLAGVEMPAPAQLCIERNRQLAPPITSWTLSSNTPIPCGIFTDYLAPLGSLGESAVFQGTVSCLIGRERSSAELKGRFLQVDLGQLTESLPHKLSGLATIQVDRAVVDQGTLRELTGDVMSPSGTVSLSLVTALAQHVPWSMPEVLLASHAPLIAYDRLEFQFSITSAGFTIASTGALSRNVILTAAGQPLLTVDQRVRYPLVSLVRALAPDSRYLVPATGTTKSLLQVLDFPSPSPRTRASDPPAPNRLRLSERPR